MRYNLPQLIDNVRTLTPKSWSEDRYRKFSGNRIMMMNDYVIQELFGRRMPFHIYHDTNRGSVDIERERLITFIVMWDQIKSVPELSEYRQIFENWNFSNQEESFKKLKEISKNLRINEDRIDLQMLSQLHMDTRFLFESANAEDSYKREYFDHYISDNGKCKNSSYIDEYLIDACKSMARFIDQLIPDWVSHWDTTLPVVQDRYSPMGPKKEDQKTLSLYLKTGQSVSSYVDSNIKLLVKAMSDAGMQTPDLNYQVKDDIQTIRDTRKLLIRVNALETQAGKPRIVFQSNDWYDVVLGPFYQFVKKCCSVFQCSFSTYKVDNNSNLNSKYSICRLASSNALDMLNSHSSNSDLKSATDKLYGLTQKELFLTFYDYISYSSKESLDSIGLTREYISSSIDILNNSYVYTEYHDDTFEIGIPYFGQLQGLRGSFHLLHWNNMLFGLAAYLKNGLTLRQWNVTSLYNGDDADLPDRVIKQYQEYWIKNSDNDVLSIDKSSSEDDIGALQFCKEFIKTDKQSPRIVNGLKPNQLIRIYQDPEQMYAFIHCDLFKQRLILRVNEFVLSLKNKYSFINFLDGMVSDDVTHQFALRSQRIRTATSYLLYQEIRDMFRDTSPRVINESRYGLTEQLVPLERARSYMIDNSSISFDQLLNLYELRKFSTIISEDASIWNPNSRVYSWIKSMKNDFLWFGKIPEYNGCIDRYQYLAVVQILRGSGCSDPDAFIGFNARSFIPEVYKLTYSGYQSESHVINCKITVG